jgi:hypothetical protein
MKPLQFLKSLLPNFSKQTVLEDIRTTRVMITAITHPAYQDAMRVFGSRKFTNVSLQKDWEVFRRNVKGAQGANTIVAVEKSFKEMLGKLDLIEQLVEKDYNDDIEGAGVTYYKAAVLQMLESIGFATDFATKYLNYVYVVEAAELNDDENASMIDEINANIVPADVRFLTERFLDFCTIMDVLAKPTDKVKADFEQIPDVTITEAGDKVVTQSLGTSKLDPFRHGIVPLVMNPIYHVRMKYAEWQHLRYEKAKAEKEALELRKMRMERLLAGKKDAALEKQIEYTQKRIDDLADHIRKVENQYG